MIHESAFPEIPPAPPDPRVPWKPADIVPRCEQSGGHIVKATTWPPVRKPSDQPNEPPSLMLQCERCESWVAVYNDTTPGVKVLKPEVAVAKK